MHFLRYRRGTNIRYNKTTEIARIATGSKNHGMIDLHGCLRCESCGHIKYSQDRRAEYGMVVSVSSLCFSFVTDSPLKNANEPSTASGNAATCPLYLSVFTRMQPETHFRIAVEERFELTATLRVPSRILFGTPSRRHKGVNFIAEHRGISLCVCVNHLARMIPQSSDGTAPAG